MAASPRSASQPAPIDPDDDAAPTEMWSRHGDDELLKATAQWPGAARSTPSGGLYQSVEAIPLVRREVEGASAGPSIVPVALDAGATPAPEKRVHPRSGSGPTLALGAAIIAAAGCLGLALGYIARQADVGGEQASAATSPVEPLRMDMAMAVPEPLAVAPAPVAPAAVVADERRPEPCVDIDSLPSVPAPAAKVAALAVKSAASAPSAPSPVAPAPLASSARPNHRRPRRSPRRVRGIELRMATLLEIAQQRLYPNYRPAPFVLTRGKGSELFDTEGRRYLDMAAGVAVCSLGHAHPRYVAAIAEQVARLGHVSNYFYNEPNILLADELCRRTKMDRAFFCNSGAEANEALLKLARRHFHTKGDAARVRLIAFDNSFHGRTMGALALTGQAKYQSGFGPGVGGVTHVPYGDLDAVRAAMGKDVAAILTETVQGEGGVVPAPPGFLAGLRALADEHGALLLFDEVQTGIGRTGTFLGCEHDGVAADAIALAKGLGGGFPIGAMLCREALSGALAPGTHGSTYGGNALASAAALAVLAVLDEEKLMEGARTKGEHLSRLLSALATRMPELLEGERGRGLLRALVLKGKPDMRVVAAKVRDHGVLLTVAGERGLRFTPPLVVTTGELDEAVITVEKALREL